MLDINYNVNWDLPVRERSSILETFNKIDSAQVWKALGLQTCTTP